MADSVTVPRGADHRRWTWDLAALAFGLVGGVGGSLTVFAVGSLPRDMESHVLLSGPFLTFVGMIVVLLASLAGLFLNIPGLHLAISAAVILLMSGYILFETGQMVNGGQTNYILTTVGLYLAILNIFTSLLHLLGAFGGDD